MIDYTQFGAQAIGEPEDDEARRRAMQPQQPAQPQPQQPGQTMQQYQGGAIQDRPSNVAGLPQSTGTSTAGSPTFRDLQVAGIPRPAPPMLVAPGGQQVGQAQGLPGQASSLSPQIADVIRQLLANPTAYGQEAMQREYDTGARKIDDDYALRQKSLNEEMARRGLYDSSVAAGGLSDLNVGRRSAQEDLMNNLLMKRADSQDQGLRSALGLAQGQQQYDADEQARQNQFLAALYQLFGL